MLLALRQLVRAVAVRPGMSDAILLQASVVFCTHADEVSVAWVTHEVFVLHSW